MGPDRMVSGVRVKFKHFTQDQVHRKCLEGKKVCWDVQLCPVMENGRDGPSLVSPQSIHKDTSGDPRSSNETYVYTVSMHEKRMYHHGLQLIQQFN